MTSNTIDALGNHHDQTGEFAVKPKNEGLLKRRLDSAPLRGAAEFRVAADVAYDDVEGDTVDELLQVRNAMQKVLYGDYEDEFGFATNQESEHPSVVEYQQVSLTAMCNHIGEQFPDAEMIKIRESDDELGSWGTVVVYDENGESINHDVNGEPIDDVTNHMMDDQVDAGDMIRSFGIHSITKLDDSITLDYNKLDGYSARIDLKRAPRTLR